MFIADTSILASFAAARELQLLLAALSTERLFIPPAVAQEVQAGLDHGAGHLQAIVEWFDLGRIVILDVEPADQETAAALPAAFGSGEREAVALVRRHRATVLCNDQQVFRYCRAHDISCLDLARLLRLIWLKGMASKAKVKTMLIRMEKVEGLVFKERDRIFAPPETRL